MTKASPIRERSTFASRAGKADPPSSEGAEAPPEPSTFASRKAGDRRDHGTKVGKVHIDAMGRRTVVWDEARSTKPTKAKAKDAGADEPKPHSKTSLGKIGNAGVLAERFAGVEGVEPGMTKPKIVEAVLAAQESGALAPGGYPEEDTVAKQQGDENTKQQGAKDEATKSKGGEPPEPGGPQSGS